MNKTSGTGLFKPTTGTSSGGFLGGGNQTQSKGIFGSSTGGGTNKTLFGGNTTGSGFGSGFGSSSGGFGSGANKTTFGTSGTGFGSGGGSNFSFGGSGNTSGNTGFNKQSIFGSSGTNTINQPTAQPAVDQNYIQAFAALNQDPYGTKGLESAFDINKIDVDKQSILSKIVGQFISYKDDQEKKASLSHFEERESFSGNFDTPISLKFTNKSKIEYNSSFKRPENPYTSSKFGFKSKSEHEAESRQLDYERVKRDEDYLSSTNKFLNSQLKKAPKISKRTSASETVRFEPQQPTSSKNQKEVREFTGPNVVRVKVVAFIDDHEEMLMVNIDKHRTIKELIEISAEKLENISADKSLIRIVHQSRILNESNTIEESEIENGMKLDMLIQENASDIGSHIGKTSDFQDVSLSRGTSLSQNQYVEREKLPVSNRPGYKLTPDIIEMARMSEYQLQNVKDLTIENEFGQVRWVDRTDARGINFDQLVEIVQFAASVYPEEIEKVGLKPEVGKGLNKPAIISLYNIYQPTKDKKTPAQFENNLRKRAESLESCTFLSYSRDSGILMFRVEHFTKYNFNECMEDEEDEREASEEKDNVGSLEQSHKETVSKERFSFGPQQPERRFQGEQEDVEFQEEEQESQSSEYSLKNQEEHRSYRRANQFLADIHEEDGSQQETVENPIAEESRSSKKNKKLNFDLIYEKSFEAEKPQEEFELDQGMLGDF